MRGDSRRDFYAKSLAVCGLGMVAGIGALIDYWPTRPATPPVRLPAVARIAAAAPRLPPPNALRVARLAAPPAPSRATDSRPDDAAPPVLAFAVATSAPASFGGVTPVALTRPPLASIAVAPTDGIPAPELPLSPLVVAAIPDAAFAVPLDLSVPAVDTDTASDNFMTGALKKTGSSIAWTGSSLVRTGSSIAGAFRAFGSAVRKVF